LEPSRRTAGTVAAGTGAEAVAASFFGGTEIVADLEENMRIWSWVSVAAGAVRWGGRARLFEGGSRISGAAVFGVSLLAAGDAAGAVV
jgi:hypothetical protein